ncbi:MAG TPA: MFS transporter [Dehalococcoidia bacterium]|nr:MFS transporter [Dehalococcoidia bacterium]
MTKIYRLARSLPTAILRWRLPITLGLLTIGVYGVVWYGYGLLMYQIHEDTHWSVSTLSAAHTIGATGGAALGVVAGISLRWVSARTLMIFGLTAGSSFILFASQTHSALWFVLCWGAGASILSACLFYHITMAIVARNHLKDRAKAFMILTLVGGFSSPLFIPIGGYLEAIGDWRLSLQIMTFAAIIFALPAIILAPARANIAITADSAIPKKSSLKQGVQLTIGTVLKDRRMQLITIIFALNGLANMGIQFHHVAAIQTYGFTLATAVAISTTRGILSLPGRAMVAYMENRFGAGSALKYVYILLLLSTILFVLEPSILTMWAFGIIGGIAFGTVLPLQGLLVAELLDEENLEAKLAMQQGFVSFVTSFGSLWMGGIYDLTSSYRFVFLIAALLQVIAVLLLHWYGDRITNKNQILRT